MKSGTFKKSITQAESFVRSVGLLEEGQRFPKIPHDFRRICRTTDYGSLWKLLYRERIYHFVFPNRSIVLFSNSPGLSYCYYECPLQSPSFDEFYQSVLGENPEAGDKDEFWEDYNEHLDTITSEKHVTPARYDYCPISYRPGAHPCSHIHIGASSNYRIGCERILTPLAFTKFIVRQCFPTVWEKYITTLDNGQKRKVESSIRTGLEPSEKFLSDTSDSCEIYFK